MKLEKPLYKRTIEGLRIQGELFLNSSDYGCPSPEEAAQGILEGWYVELESLPPQDILDFFIKHNQDLDHLRIVSYEGKSYYLHARYEDWIWSEDGKKVTRRNKAYQPVFNLKFQGKRVFPDPMSRSFYNWCESYFEKGFTYNDYLKGVRLQGLSLEKDAPEPVVVWVNE